LSVAASTHADSFLTASPEAGAGAARLLAEVALEQAFERTAVARLVAGHLVQSICFT